jgi:hypothetical protein
MAMSDSRQTNRKKLPAAPAETARQEGAQGRTGKTSTDAVSDGAVDTSDPAMAADVTEIADQVHANA